MSQQYNFYYRYARNALWCEVIQVVEFMDLDSESEPSDPSEMNMDLDYEFDEDREESDPDLIFDGEDPVDVE